MVQGRINAHMIPSLKLLKNYIHNFLIENSSISKKNAAAKIIAASEENPSKFGKWIQVRPKYGEIRLSPASELPIDFKIEELLNSAGYEASLSPTSKSGFPTWLATSSEGEVFDVIFTIKNQNGRKITDKILETGKMLGYGGEHAVFAAINNLSFDQLVANISEDLRIKPELAKVAQADALKFFDDCASMKDAAQKELQKLNKQLTSEEPPGGGVDLVDVVAVDSDNNPYYIHVKYKSDRLVGLQKSKQKVLQTDVETVKDASTIYQNVRDSLLFKSGIKGGIKILDDQGKLIEEYLTPFGMEVLRLQKQQGSSEIVAIMSDPDLRNALISELSKNNFEQALEDGIKQQLGLSQPYESETQGTTIFIKFLSNNKAKMEVFTPAMQDDIKFNVRPGESTYKVFTVDILIKSDASEIKNVFYVELGSIKRGKFVQIHRGQNFSEFQKFMDSRQNV